MSFIVYLIHTQKQKLLTIVVHDCCIADGNIVAMIDLMEESEMIPTCSSEEDFGPTNPLTNTQSTHEQAHDLLNFRQIGQAEFEAYVRYHILQSPNVDAPQRRKRLQTFDSTRQTKKKTK